MLWVSAALCFLSYGLQPSDPSQIVLAVVLIVVVIVTGTITF